jgi:O-antigen ligase
VRDAIQRRRALLVGLCGLVAGLAATLVQVGSDPASLRVGAAAAHVFVDSQAPSVVRRRAAPQEFEALTKRAELLARVMVSPPVVARAARRMGVPADRVAALGRDTGSLPHALTEPDSEERAWDIVRSRAPYRLEIHARPTGPLLDVYAQAPSADAAERLAEAAVGALDDHLRELGREQRADPAAATRLRLLGPARGAVVNSGVPAAVAVLTFVVAFVTTCCVLLGAFALTRRRAEAPAPAAAGDDWPHTTRLLPWMLAAFIGLLWLVPFNEIQLSASLPIDLKLDRLVLPFVAALWVVALVGGGAGAPRVRLTRIHAAVGGFVLCAFVSVVIDARYLNHTLEIDQSLKRLPLLVAYVSLFFIAASAVRRSEVQAFLTLTLGLAVACAAGIIWEYRFEHNLFFALSDGLLPGVFTVAPVDPGGIDAIGRRAVRGPAAVPLEAVAMLSMALPIGIVWLIKARDLRGRVLSAVAVCLLLAAMIATFRKSALLIPMSVVATLAYYRRRELLRLAPLLLVLVLAVHVLSPGALGSTTAQLDSDRLGVATVSDRAVDYDAVRPDVWSHLLMGRGWGTYDFVNYRILDSEILQRTIEMGVLGLVAFLLMGGSVLSLARHVIRSDPERAPLALVGAAAAVAFLVASTLFDVLSFPHDTYVFLYMAGLVAVVAGPVATRGSSATPAHHRAKAASATPMALMRP